MIPLFNCFHFRFAFAFLFAFFPYFYCSLLFHFPLLYSFLICSFLCLFFFNLLICSSVCMFAYLFVCLSISLYLISYLSMQLSVKNFFSLIFLLHSLFAYLSFGGHSVNFLTMKFSISVPGKKKANCQNVLFRKCHIYVVMNLAETSNFKNMWNTVYSLLLFVSFKF